MADFYLKSGGGAIVYSNRAWTNGEKMVPTLGDGSSNANIGRAWVWEVTTAGTSNATPTWPASVTQDTTTITQNGVVWTARKPGFSSGSTANWAFAAIYMHYVALAMAAGDRLFVSNNHAESQNSVSSASTFAGTVASPCQILCVDDTQTDPASMTLATTGQVTTLSQAGVSLSGCFYCYGVKFSGSSTGVGSNLTICGSVSANDVQVFEKCLLKNGSSDNTRRILVGNTTNPQSCRALLVDCDVSFGDTTQTFSVSGELEWRGGSLLAGTSAITSLLRPGSRAGSAVISGVDLSNGAAGLTLVLAVAGGSATSFKAIARDCKMPTSWSGDAISGTVQPGLYAAFHNCDVADTQWALRVGMLGGTVVDESTIVRTGSDSAQSWKMVSSADAEYPLPTLESPEIAKRITDVGSAKSVSVEILHDSATNLTDAEIWLEVMYMGTSGNPLGTWIRDSKANVLATAADQTTSAASWTTTGLSNPNKQKLSVTFTPQEAGYVHARVHLAKASYTVYVDPNLTVA